MQIDHGEAAMLAQRRLPLVPVCCSAAAAASTARGGGALAMLENAAVIG
jgi:hypothetical protein